mmetsp:Transcript_117707/g.333031  ORF Transcript_117707/g.333031 Transcript_117707/m.333031 type:complete len:218 (+) Transcript_117707:1043-1696(+)
MKAPCHPSETFRSDPALAEGVALGRIETSGNEDCFRFEPLEERAKDVVEDVARVQIGIPFVQGDVHCIAARLGLSGVLQYACAREETLGIESVHAEKEHLGVVRKQVACAIAMVHVPIDDSHALDPMLLLEMASCHCHIVEQAEARGAIFGRVVARRPDDGHATTRRRLLVEARVDEAKQATSRKPCGACCVLANISIWAEGEAVGLRFSSRGALEV